MIRKHASGGVEINADSRLAAVRPVTAGLGVAAAEQHMVIA
jgi:hypothetical protein